MTTLTMQILSDGHWIDVHTRLNTHEGIKTLYRTMCKECPNGPPYGLRIVTVHLEYLGRYPTRRSHETA